LVKSLVKATIFICLSLNVTLTRAIQNEWFVLLCKQLNDFFAIPWQNFGYFGRLDGRHLVFGKFINGLDITYKVKVEGTQGGQSKKKVNGW
jgi:cyclophilin family peptidyl-prolyl cis-trans isomerase